MQFELTGALIDDILFSMEDQEGNFFVDTRNGTVAGGSLIDGEEQRNGPHEDRFIDLPEWDSSDGFRLMERFTAGFKNHLIQEELNGALNRGKGVFRAFKDILGSHPEAEKLWFAYKEREMKRKIIGWYNTLREEWGLLKIGNEPEETGDLVLEDFRFRRFRQEDRAAALTLHEACEKENPAVKDYYKKFPNKSELPGTHAWAAESASGEFAGFISAAIKDGSCYIEFLEVKPEYRGLGLGETLLARFLENISAEESPSGLPVYLELPVNAEGFSRVLAREKFKPCMICYRLEPEDREASTKTQAGFL